MGRCDAAARNWQPRDLGAVHENAGATSWPRDRTVGSGPPEGYDPYARTARAEPNPLRLLGTGLSVVSSNTVPHVHRAARAPEHIVSVPRAGLW